MIDQVRSRRDDPSSAEELCGALLITITRAGQNTCFVLIIVITDGE